MGDASASREPSTAKDRGATRAHAIVALAGASLTLIQYVALRELASLVGSNELVALIVLSAYFLGLSFGYLLSDRLSPRALTVLGLGTLALHTTLPFSARWMAAILAEWKLGGAIPPVIFLLVLFGVTPFYALFLPRLIDEVGKQSLSLGPLYSTEILGALAGLLTVVVVTPARVRIILTIHLAELVALIFLSNRGAVRRLLPLALVPIAYLLAFPTLDAASLEHYYARVRGIRGAKVIASELSPYQRVDLIRGSSAEQDSLYLFLNGNLLYGSRRLNQHNLMVSILPNLVTTSTTHNALVIAGGSLDAARFLTPRVKKLTVVEIDEAVTRLMRQHYQEPRGNFPSPSTSSSSWTARPLPSLRDPGRLRTALRFRSLQFDLVIDDGKHFLGSWKGAPFDVISIDVPVPTHLQTAMLHSERFFELARSRLAPGGIFSISLSGALKKANPKARSFRSAHLQNRVVAGLLMHFPHVTVVRAAGRDFAWASVDPFPLDVERLRERLAKLTADPEMAAAFGSPELTLEDDAEVRARAAGFQPIGEADMQVVLQMSLNKLLQRFYEDD